MQPSSSEESLKRGVVVVVHAGHVLPRDWVNEADIVLDARSRDAWSILTELNTHASKLPLRYDVNVDYDWLEKPTPISSRKYLCNGTPV